MYINGKTYVNLHTSWVDLDLMSDDCVTDF